MSEMGVMLSVFTDVAVAEDAAYLHQFTHSPSSIMWRWRPKNFTRCEKIAIFRRKILAQRESRERGQGEANRIEVRMLLAAYLKEILVDGGGFALRIDPFELDLIIVSLQHCGG